jgi:hypothetical protein
METARRGSPGAHLGLDYLLSLVACIDYWLALYVCMDCLLSLVVCNWCDFKVAADSSEREYKI